MRWRPWMTIREALTFEQRLERLMEVREVRRELAEEKSGEAAERRAKRHQHRVRIKANELVEKALATGSTPGVALYRECLELANLMVAEDA